MSKKRNALKQRAHAFEVMLWSEKYEDYEALRAGVYEEYPPAGSSEEYEVGTLVDLLWRRRRLDLLERLNLQNGWIKFARGTKEAVTCKIFARSPPISARLTALKR
jgi:hypothetical protein